jgi:hypothetical protein
VKRVDHNLAVACIFAASAWMVGAEEGATPHAFVKTHCVKCHNAEKHKGKLELVQSFRPSLFTLATPN